MPKGAQANKLAKRGVLRGLVIRPAAKDAGGCATSNRSGEAVYG